MKIKFDYKISAIIGLIIGGLIVYFFMTGQFPYEQYKFVTSGSCSDYTNMKVVYNWRNNPTQSSSPLTCIFSGTTTDGTASINQKCICS